MNRPLRIAICGTHGTGKTTLARELSKRMNLPMIEEVARRVIRNAGYETTRQYIEKANELQKSIIQSKILEAQMLAEVAYSDEGFVADRSVFDAVSYSVAYGLPRFKVNELLGEAMGHALTMYDLLVFIPPYWMPEEDGFRDTDIDLWGKVNAEIVRYINAFEMLGGRVLRTKMTNLELRIHEVMDTVRNLEARHEVV